MADGKLDLELILRKVIRQDASGELTIEKACRKVAKKAHKRGGGDVKLLMETAKVFLAKARADGAIRVRKGLVSLPKSASLKEAPTPAQAEDQQAKGEDKTERPAKRRKLPARTGTLKAAAADGTTYVPTQKAEKAKGSAVEEAPSKSAANTPGKGTSAASREVKTASKGAEEADSKSAKRQKKAHSTPVKAADPSSKRKTEAASTEAEEADPVRAQKKKKAAAKKSLEKNGAKVPSLSNGSSEKAVKRKKKEDRLVKEDEKGGPDEAMPLIKGEMGWKDSRNRKDIKHGRFSQGEKDAIKAAAVAFATEKGLSETNFDWLLQTKKGAQRELTAGAWKTIASQALPHRSARAVFNCGTRILHPCNFKGPWTTEEMHRLKELVQTRGKKWKDIGEELGRMPLACRDKYREIATGEDSRGGKWSLEECKKLQQAVEEYLSMKQEQEEKLASPKAATLSFEDMPTPVKSEKEVETEDGRALLDDVNWDVVAHKVGTRSRVQCMDKWYRNLAPSMITQGEWGVGDDRRLLKGLLWADARQAFLAPWEDLVKGRTSQQTKRRWNLMVKRVPDFNEKEFPQQLEYLADTFAPGLRKKIEALRGLAQAHEGSE